MRGREGLRLGILPDDTGAGDWVEMHSHAAFALGLARLGEIGVASRETGGSFCDGRFGDRILRVGRSRSLILCVFFCTMKQWITRLSTANATR